MTSKDKLQADIAELNQRLIDRQETLMTAIVALKQATQLLTRCSASKQMSLLLQDDIREFLKSQPSYRC
jgi:predicted  nucleic acid-binding Zn-ribbon protein